MLTADSCHITLVIDDNLVGQPFGAPARDSEQQQELHAALEACGFAEQQQHQEAQQHQQQQQHHHSCAASRNCTQLCRADSASEGILSNRVSSRQLSLGDIVLEQPVKQLDIGLQQEAPHSNFAAPERLRHDSHTGCTTAADNGALRACSPVSIQGMSPRVWFKLEASNSAAAATSTDSPHAIQRPSSSSGMRPALRIDIPFELALPCQSSSSSHPTPLASTRWPQLSASNVASTVRDGVQLQQHQPLAAQDLAQRLLQLGMQRAVTASDSDSDDEQDGAAGPVVLGVGNCRWQGPLPHRSCGDLLSLSANQQHNRRHDDVSSSESWGAAGLPSPYGGACAARSSCRRSNVDQGAANSSCDADKLPSLSPGLQSHRRPPARLPSRIILSPVAPDGSTTGPRLFVSIPKPVSGERRCRRPVGRASTGSLAITPHSGSSGNRVLQQLLGPSSAAKVTVTATTPKAAAAAAAAAGMPYNVAVAAAQLLGSRGSMQEEAAAAMAAAVANEQRCASPLGSPVLAAPAPSGRSTRMLPLTPTTPVHPVVAAAAAAAIAAAADAADEGAQEAAVSTTDEVAAASADQGSEVCSLGGGSDEASDTMEDSGSEEWWCGSLTGLVVNDVMTPIQVVHQDMGVDAARHFMLQQNLQAVLVDTGAAPGWLTRRDMFKASLRRRSSKKRHPKATVRSVMSHPVIAVDARQSIEVCAQLLQEKGIHRAAVRNADNADLANPLAEYVGLVSDAAIFKCLGLYPEEDIVIDDQDQHLMRLSSGTATVADSSIDGSGIATPCSGSRADTPPVSGVPARALPVVQHQQQQQPVPDAVGTAAAAAATSSLSSQLDGSSNGDISNLFPAVPSPPNMLLMREGLCPGSFIVSVSLLDSMKSAQSNIQRSSEDENYTPTAAGLRGSSAAGSELAAAGAICNVTGSAAVSMRSSSQAPDALARYKTAAQLWEVDMGEVEFTRRIGEGSFGEVVLASYRGTKVAVKRLHALDLDDTPHCSHHDSTIDGEAGPCSACQQAHGGSLAAFKQFFEREIAILASIRHPNVVNFIGACHKPGQRCLVTEYCARGSLDHVLHKSGLALDLAKRVEFAMDVARGMACLHAQRPIIIHRDLKTANLLVSARFEVKVADFGLSRIKDASQLQVSCTGLEGTIEYCAPEVLRGEPYTERCDVYSFGVVLWELLLRQRPYSDADVPVFLLMVNIGNGSLKLPPVPVEAVTPGLVDLVNRCCAFSAGDRLEFREVLQLLEAEYRALRSTQQRPQSRPQLQQRQQQQASASCSDSASSMHVQQSPLADGQSPTATTPPWQRASAGKAAAQGVKRMVPHAAGTAAGAYAAACEAACDGLQFQGGCQPQMYMPPLPPQLVQPLQPAVLHRHRLSQQGSLASSGGSFGWGPVGSASISGSFMCEQQQQQQLPAYQEQHHQHQQADQQQLHSVPGMAHLQHAGNSGSSPRRGSGLLQPPFPYSFVQPELVQLMPAMQCSADAALPQQQQPQQVTSRRDVILGWPLQASMAAAGGSANKPTRRRQMSRARSVPMPTSLNWELDGQQDAAGKAPTALNSALQSQGSSHSDFAVMYSTSGLPARYAPCSNGQLCVLMEPASTSHSGAGGVYLAHPQQQTVYAQSGQIMHAASAQYSGMLQPLQPLQQPQQFMYTVSGSGSATPIPPAPMCSSPNPTVNPLAVMAAAGAAAAAARRHSSGSGAASPGLPCSLGNSSRLPAAAIHSRNNTYRGLREMPALQLFSEVGGSTVPVAPEAPQASGPCYSAGSTANLAPANVPQGVTGVEPPLLQRVDSLHRSSSGSTCGSILHYLPAPALQDDSSSQLGGVMVGDGSPAGGTSPLNSFSGLLYASGPRHTSSRLAFQGSYELPPPVMPFNMAYSGTLHADQQQQQLTGIHQQVCQYLQQNRRPSLLRIDSNNRDSRSNSPFSVTALAAASIGSCTNRSQFAAASSTPVGASRSPGLDPFGSTADAASGALCHDVEQADNRCSTALSGCVDAASSMCSTDVDAGSIDTGAGAATMPVGAARAGHNMAGSYHYASPFAAASGAAEGADTGAVSDINTDVGRQGSPTGRRDVAASPAESKFNILTAAAGSTAGRHAKPCTSPFALLQQQELPAGD